MILYIKHIDIEGPGTIETYFEEKGFKSKMVSLHKGERLPKNFDDIDAIISLGGPINVDEEEKFPFLRDEDIFLKKAIQEEVPILGICLGSQLLAKASGARVIKSPVKEVGWFKAKLIAQGETDPLFAGIGDEIDVYHWHEDMWELPKTGKLLATSLGCPNQAFKIGKNAYGLQFHVEVTEDIIKDWCKNYFASADVSLQKKAQEMLQTYAQKKNQFNTIAYKMYENFAKIIESSRVKVY